MSGYLDTSGSWTVSDKGPSTYPQTVTATLYVTINADNSCAWEIDVSHPSYNYYKVYLSIAGTECLNKYQSIYNTKTSTHSGKTTVTGASASITFGIATSQDSLNASYMTYKYATLTRTTWSDGGAPSLEIIDNGNNTITFKGYLGKNGTNNAMTGSTLYYTVNGQEPNGAKPWTYAVSLGKVSEHYFEVIVPGTINNTSYPGNTSPSRTVWGVVYCSWSHGNNTNTGHISKTVKYYVNPNPPGKPELSYSKSRLTLKENWTFTWPAATAGNTDSPIVGYRIRLYRNNNVIPIKFSNGQEAQPGYSWYDRGNTSNSIVLDPVANGFQVGDKVRLGVYAWAVNGKGTWLFNNNGAGDGHILSDEYTVQNAGIMRVKPSGTWKEGIVHVKVNDVWKEADLVQTKASSGWKESE